LKLCNVHAELIALLQNALAALLDESIELGAKLGHAIAQLVEAEVGVGQRVGG
jgi:hypothetical protein